MTYKDALLMLKSNLQEDLNNFNESYLTDTYNADVPDRMIYEKHARGVAQAMTTQKTIQNIDLLLMEVRDAD